MPVGIVCGFKAEQRIAQEISVHTACAWRNDAAAKALVEAGVDCLVSFGLAGALDPSLVSGDIVLPCSIVNTSKRVYKTDTKLVQALIQAFSPVHGGLILGSSGMAVSAEGKRQLFNEYHALAVDMETAAIADTAEAAGIPFCVFRVIADEAGHDLPPAAIDALDDHGAVALPRILGSLLAHPEQLPSLIRLGHASGKAMRVLRASAPVLREVLQ